MGRASSMLSWWTAMPTTLASRADMEWPRVATAGSSRCGPAEPRPHWGMAIDLEQQWFRDLSELRYAATPKRLRALLDGRPVLDTRDAMLVYEPRRVVPWYAVPP